ncbi:unnamed protein product [Sympodiomycopsis kandeliae]
MKSSPSAQLERDMTAMDQEIQTDINDLKNVIVEIIMTKDAMLRWAEQLCSSSDHLKTTINDRHDAVFRLFPQQN